MKSLDEIKKEKDEMETLVQKIADYMNFMEPMDEELNEEDLDLVAAAGPETQYERFLRKMNKK